LPAVFIAAVIWFLSSQSILPKPKGILGFDKIQHVIAYAVFAVTLALWFPPRWWKYRRLWTVLAAACLASAYGGVDEIHQYFVPGRDCNVWDWAADTIGALAGSGLALLAAGRVGRKLLPEEGI
jgi:VanZ family protein